MKRYVIIFLFCIIEILTLTTTHAQKQSNDWKNPSIVSINREAYTEDDLEKAAHPYELPTRDFINLNTDLNIHGVGGNDAWGARTLDKYTIDGKESYYFGFILEYIKNR